MLERCQNMSEKDTPMMKQYRAAKQSLGKDHLLFFRLGDFYEMFFEDASIGSKLLGITLTQRGQAPMCGVPAHAVDTYIKKLLILGQKIAICDQTSPVKKGSIVDREIVETITPGTISNLAYLDSSASNYLGAITIKNTTLVYAWIDISTADLYVETREYSMESIRQLLGKTNPKELLFSETLEEALWIHKIRAEFSIHCTPIHEWDFSIEEGARQLKEKLQIETLKSYNLTETSIELLSICALFCYISKLGKNTVTYLSTVNVIRECEFLELDSDALYNLEIFSSMREQDKKFSLLGVLNKTLTAMGARELYNWLSFPLKNVEAILQRQSQLECFLSQDELRNNVQRLLSNIIDIPRILSRITLNKTHPKDLQAMRQSLFTSLEVFDYCNTSCDNQQNNYIYTLLSVRTIERIKELYDLLKKVMTENPPMQFGGDYVINRGYNVELDALRDIYENQQEVLTAYVAREQAQTSITLRLKYNNLIGYFFDITQGQREQCPTHFIHRQSLTKQDRYKTSELVALETEILDAEKNLLVYEEQLFTELLNQLQRYIIDINKLSNAIAVVDVCLSFSLLTLEHNYVRPEITDDFLIEIEKGRHPVIESHQAQGEFIANDMTMNDKQSFIMLTGPNMSGKSTYLRQNALIVIMAQIGCYVPASSAKIGIRDKVFCRVGASDNLVKGESTFLVEMSETAYILQQATDRSLVIMDEIGRGTSVVDGESIAQAVAEYFLAKNIFTLFVTHYHNLTDLKFDNMKNYTLSIERNKGKIIFTRHIKEGAIKNSYGIEVAKLAGVPKPILERAQQLLNTRITKNEEGDAQYTTQIPIQGNLGFFENGDGRPGEFDKVVKEVLNIIIDCDVNTLSPMNALHMLVELQTTLHDNEIDFI